MMAYWKEDAMRGPEAIKYMDESIARAREARRDRGERSRSWYWQARQRQDAVDAQAKAVAERRYTDTKSYGFIEGPMSAEWVADFLRQYRQFRESQESCEECEGINDKNPESPGRLMCSLHHSWGHGMCWKHGE
jgi:hypothetical protein